MDAGSVSKPAYVQATPTEFRPQSQAAAERTVMAPEKAVTASRDSERARFDRKSGQTAAGTPDRDPQDGTAADRSPVERRLTIDDESGRVLLQAVHSGSGEVVWQLPAETILKLGTYAREQREGGTPEPTGGADAEDERQGFEVTA